MDLQVIYEHAPHWCQNLLVSIEGWRIYKNRYGGLFQHFLSDYEKRTYWSYNDIKLYSMNRLQKFIKHCFDTVPFYQKLFRKIGIYPEDIKEPSDLKILPIINKEDIQDNIDEFTSKGVPKRERIMIHTSGTTGAGLRFASTRIALQEQWATWWRYFHWHGIEFGTWCAHFGGRLLVPVSQKEPPFWRYNYPGKQIIFSAYHMSKKNLKFYIEELRKKRPLWIHGYPSLISLIADYMLEKKIDLGYQVRWITCGAENLLEHQRKAIKKAFGVNPKQHYGMAEAVGNISECEYGKLHLDEDFAFLEFIAEKNSQTLRMIGTNFTNPATPLLRYDTKDFAKLSTDSCRCGRPGRVIEQIDGRLEDYVILKDGTKIGRLDHVFKDLVNIREAQIYQKSLNEIIIKVVKSKNYITQDEITLLEEFKRRVGNDINISIDYVDQIERSKSGKFRFVISEVKEAKIDSYSNP